jgi:hypothetical protein
MSVEKISNALGIEVYDPTIEDKNLPATIEQVPEGMTEAEVDFDKVRSNTYELLDDAMCAVKELVDISSRSQDHESYSSLATLIKTVSALNNDLLVLQEKKKKLLSNEKDSDKNVTNNNTLVLTTAEFQKMLLENKKE